MPTIIQPKKRFGLEKILSSLILTSLFYLLGLITLAEFGLFNKQNIYILLLLFVVYLFYIRKLFKTKKFSLNKIEVVVLLIIICLTAFSLLYQSELSLINREAGNISAAQKITESQKLFFGDSLAKTYDYFTTNNLNNTYSNLSPLFNSLLAANLIIFGENYRTATILPAILLILLATYYLGKNLKNELTGLISLILLATFCGFIYLSRGIGQELLFYSLLFFGSWYFLCAYKKSDLKNLLLGCLPFSLLLFLEPIGLLFFISYLVALLSIFYSDRWEFKKNFRRQFTYFLPSLITTALFIFYCIKINPHYFDVFLSQLNYIWLDSANLLHLSLFLFFIVFLVVLYVILRYLKISNKNIRRFIFLSIVFYLLFYLINTYAGTVKTSLSLSYFIVSLLQYKLAFFILLILFLIYKKYLVFSYKKLVIIFLPAIIYPFVLTAESSTQYLVGLTIFFATGIFIILSVALSNLKNSSVKNYLLVLLVALNLSVSYSMINIINNKNIETAINDLALNFSTADLILFEPGESWENISYPMHFVKGLNIIPSLKDYSEQELKLLLGKYDNIYVISDNNPYAYPYLPKNKLVFIKEAFLNYQALDNISLEITTPPLFYDSLIFRPTHKQNILYIYTLTKE